MSERDKTMIEYREVREQMRGISPQLSVYKSLESQAKILLEKLGGIKDNEREFIPRRTAMLNGVKVMLNGVKVKIKYPSQKPRPNCKFEGCTKPSRTHGRDRYGNQKFEKYCGEHLTQAKRQRKRRLQQENAVQTI